ncbi:hypothetical protein FHS85_003951 [Rhodoligotrophos appendicifer]|uniref:hypothetical protein n=1 Tax=Rhodoligotrophos appendicifer TaxID=987056 RepID=UPI001185201D|nr:hypothetical protein [Rhodoligotrophos appendicifer]
MSFIADTFNGIANIAANLVGGAVGILGGAVTGVGKVADAIVHIPIDASKIAGDTLTNIGDELRGNHHPPAAGGPTPVPQPPAESDDGLIYHATSSSSITGHVS